MQLLIKMLEDRLLMESLLKKHPEIREEELAPPVFIVGFPRTGTTHLHNLMSQDEKEFRSVRPYANAKQTLCLSNEYGAAV